MLARLKIRFQYLQESIEVLNGWNLSGHEPRDQFVRFSWVNVVEDPHEFGEGPVENGRDKA